MAIWNPSRSYCAEFEEGCIQAAIASWSLAKVGTQAVVIIVEVYEGMLKFILVVLTTILALNFNKECIPWQIGDLL